MSNSAVVARTEAAGLKDTKRIRFPQNFGKNASKAGQERSKLRANPAEALRRGGAWMIIAIPPLFARAAQPRPAARRRR
jgi:hypothetical protein